MQVINGTMSGSTIVVSGDQSWGQAYDAAGNAVLKYTEKGGQTLVGLSQYTLRGQRLLEFHGSVLGETSGGVAKKSVYDAAGRLTETVEYYASDETKTAHIVEYDEITHSHLRYNLPVNVGGMLQRRDTYQYDGDGRLLLMQSYARQGNWAAQFYEEGRQQIQVTTEEREYQSTELGVLTATGWLAYTDANGNSGYDALGRVAVHRYGQTQSTESSVTGNAGLTVTYTHSYVGRDGWLEAGVSADAAEENYRDGNTAIAYDAWGRRTAQTETNPLPDYETTLTRKRFFSYDGGGQVLTRRDGTLDADTGAFEQTGNGSYGAGANPVQDFITQAQWEAMTTEQRQHWQGLDLNQRFVYVNGQQVARLSEAGDLEVSETLTAFDSSSIGTTETTVQDGDTLATIAQRVYGNSSLWYVLAEANAVTDGDLFVGQSLKVPAVRTHRNDASTFQPYNPAETLGPTEPATPYIAPPPPTECNMLATVIRIFAVVVALVVPVVGFFLGAAIAGLGEAVAQTVEIQDGDRQGYNGGAILGSAVMGGLTANAGPLGGMTKWAKAADISKIARFGRLFAVGAAQSLMSTAASAGFNKLLGEDPNFSWRNTAASAVTAGLANGIFGSISLGKGGESTVANATAKTATTFRWEDALKAAGQAIAKEAIGYGVRKLIVGEAQWSWRSVAASVVTEVAGSWAASLREQQWAQDRDRNLGMAAQPSQTSQIVTDASSLPGQGARMSMFNWMFHDGVGFDADPWGLSAQSAMGGVTTAGMLTARGSFGAAPMYQEMETGQFYQKGQSPANAATLKNLRTGEETRHLGTVEVTGNADRDYAYFSAWQYGVLTGAPGPRPGMSRQELQRVNREQVNWYENHPGTLAYRAWVAKSWEGRAINSQAGAQPYQYGQLGRAINGAVETLATPLTYARDVLDGGMEVLEQGVASWKRYSQSTVDNANGPIEAGVAGVFNALNQSFATLADGGIGGVRVFTNNGRMVTAAVGIEQLASQRPMDTVRQVKEHIAGMSGDELLQDGLTLLVGGGMSGAGGVKFLRALKGGPSVNSGLSRAVGDWDELTIDVRPSFATRADDYMFSPQGKDIGGRKSHIDGDMRLVPANAAGDTTALQHVYSIGKNNSPYTSFSERLDQSVRSYGNSAFQVDLRALRKDIGNGLLQGVEVIDNAKLMRMHESAVSSARENLLLRNNRRNRDALETAEWGLSNSQRDHELLIFGIVPRQYLIF